jgi:hypothetical protein
MKIRGRVTSHEKPVADATVQLWLVKRSDGAEIDVVQEIRSDDSGAFEIAQSTIDGVPYNPQYFKQVKYSVEKPLYQPAQDSRSLDNDEEEINLGDIDLAWKALRVQGEIASNARPVKGATVILQLDNVERARILTNHEGKFTRDIEGDYHGRTLMWTAKRFGYISEMGSIQGIRSIEVEVKEDDLVLHWWAGICQSLGVDPRIVLGVLGLLLSLGVGVILSTPKPPPCLESSVTAADFQKKGVNSRDIETAFSECLFISQGLCGKEKDASIRQCMENRGYKYSK